MDSVGFFRHGEFVLRDARRRGKNFRFAPEPSGPLHLGHLKTFRANFECAAKYGGEMILRFDDTNPEKSREEHCAAAMEVLEWLGYDVDTMRITYTSDYFEVLLEHARRLVRTGHAFVCRETVVGRRGRRAPSSWRDRPVEESATELERMVRGECAEGEAVLRLRYADAHFADPVAYRVKGAAHFRCGRRWRVFPTYDFSHPVIDSLEDIGVSLCTMEFAHHRPLYAWMQRRLDIPAVPQCEQPRLQLEGGVVLSKRALTALVGVWVDSLDDPRLATLGGLRARGIPPKAIVAFVAHGFRTFPQLLDLTRKELLPITPPFNVVLDPLQCHVVDSPSCTKDDFASFFLISRHDFEEAPEGSEDEDEEGCPLTLNRMAGLLGVEHKVCVKAVKERCEDGAVSRLEVVVSRGQKVRGLRSIAWVSHPVRITLVYVHHQFIQESNPRPAPLRSVEAYADAEMADFLRMGSAFTYGQTFRAAGLGYITLAPHASQENLVFYVTALLKLSNKARDRILRCFKEMQTGAHADFSNKNVFTSENVPSRNI